MVALPEVLAHLVTRLFRRHPRRLEALKGCSIETIARLHLLSLMTSGHVSTRPPNARL